VSETPTTRVLSGDEQRTLLAAERTMLAWIRTGLALMGFGFLIERFGIVLREVAEMRNLPVTEAHRFSLWLGVGLVALGVLVNLLGSIEHLRVVKPFGELHSPTLRASLWSVLLSLLLALLGVAMAIYLLAL
jgi:putative membrane protein